jgi:protein import protein ZIM17
MELEDQIILTVILWQYSSLTFTCSVENCGERSTHEFTKRSYTKGIVIVQCPGCKNR